MHRAERRVAVTHRGDEYADADEIVDLVELLSAKHHLLVDRVEVLRPAVDLSAESDLLELGPQRREHFLGQLLPLVAALVNEARDLVIRTRMQRLEREILELPLDLHDAE